MHDGLQTNISDHETVFFLEITDNPSDIIVHGDYSLKCNSLDFLIHADPRAVILENAEIFDYMLMMIFVYC